MLDSINSRIEREQLIEEITQKVLSRLSMQFNTSDGLKKIESLKNALDELFNKINNK